MPELKRFRRQWVLRHRSRPVVPKPKGLLPRKGILDKERRAMFMFFSLYLRPWVLLKDHATARVPHITNLDLVVLRHQHGLLYPQVIKRRRLSVRDTVGHRLAPEWTKRSYCTAWATYTQGNVVSDSQAQTIQNFTLVMAGTGKHENEEESGGSRVKRETLGCAGQKLDSTEIRAVLHEVKPPSTLMRRKPTSSESV